MTAERAIELLSGGTHMPAVPHTTDELDEACRIACDALRLYTQSFQKAYSLNAAIADHYRFSRILHTSLSTVSCVIGSPSLLRKRIAKSLI